jgi:hypothetical protein
MKGTMKPIIDANVDRGSQLYTDEYPVGWWNKDEYMHESVNHLAAYVVGNCHTNGLENFWSL